MNWHGKKLGSSTQDGVRHLPMHGPGTPLSSQETNLHLNIDTERGWVEVASSLCLCSLSANSGKQRLTGLCPHLLPGVKGRREAGITAGREKLRSKLP